MKYIYLALFIVCILFAWATGDFLIVELIPPVAPDAPGIVKWVVTTLLAPDNVVDWLFPHDPALSVIVFMCAFAAVMLLLLIVSRIARLGRATRHVFGRCTFAFGQGALVGGMAWGLVMVANLSLTPWLYAVCVVGAVIGFLVLAEFSDAATKLLASPSE